MIRIKSIRREVCVLVWCVLGASCSGSEYDGGRSLSDCWNNGNGNAIALEWNVTTHGSTHDGALSSGDLINNDLLCAQVPITSPGAWYTITVDDPFEVTASTCSYGASFDTKLSVFVRDAADAAGTGSHGTNSTCALKCIHANDDSLCGLQSEVTWQVPTNQTIQYYILVHGHATTTGDFDLLVSHRSLGTRDNATIIFDDDGDILVITPTYNQQTAASLTGRVDTTNTYAAHTDTQNQHAQDAQHDDVADHHQAHFDDDLHADANPHADDQLHADDEHYADNGHGDDHHYADDTGGHGDDDHYADHTGGHGDDDHYANDTGGHGDDDHYADDTGGHGDDDHHADDGGGHGYDEPVYYSVFSVGVLTLGLLLIVEIFNHQLEHSARNQPFYKAVVEQVYRELATLGIVELFIHLLHEYYDKLDLAKEALFADVHFVIFYTAILNALASTILAYISTKISYNMWVKTEELEVNHYIEIREEFDRLDSFLNSINYHNHDPDNSENEENDPVDNDNHAAQEQQLLRKRQRQKFTASVWNSSIRRLGQASSPTSQNNIANGVRGSFLFRESSMGTSDHGLTSDDLGTINNSNTKNYYNNRNNISNMITSFISQVRDKAFFYNKRIYNNLRYPHKISKYNRLLVKVRFHELRVHLLRANNLPLQLKISGYLMRSEQAVLISLIQVHLTTWLWLLGGTNMLYYFMGIALTFTTSHAVISVALSILYFLIMIMFAIFSILVYKKMQRVFLQIMHMELLMEEEGESLREGTQEEKDKKDILAKKQLHFFWFGKPKFIIASIQIMQFGFAIALSVLIVFWDTVTAGSKIHGWYYVIPLLIFFAAWILIMAYVIPQYTLATGLGRLVDKQRLHETVAAFNLVEAERKHQESRLKATTALVERNGDEYNITNDDDQNPNNIYNYDSSNNDYSDHDNFGYDSNDDNNKFRIIKKNSYPKLPVVKELTDDTAQTSNVEKESTYSFIRNKYDIQALPTVTEHSHRDDTDSNHVDDIFYGNNEKETKNVYLDMNDSSLENRKPQSPLLKVPLVSSSRQLVANTQDKKEYHGVAASLTSTTQDSAETLSTALSGFTTTQENHLQDIGTELVSSFSVDDAAFTANLMRKNTSPIQQNSEKEADETILQEQQTSRRRSWGGDLKKSLSDDVGSMRLLTIHEQKKELATLNKTASHHADWAILNEKRQQLPTASLPLKPVQIDDISLASAKVAVNRQRPRLRKKSLSDNVAFSNHLAMSDFWSSNAEVEGLIGKEQRQEPVIAQVDNPILAKSLTASRQRPNRIRKKSLSDNGAFAKHLENSDFWNPNPLKDGAIFKDKKKGNELSVEKGTILAELVGKDTTALRKLIPPEEKLKLESKSEEQFRRRSIARAGRRHNRQKSVSDGVAAMSRMSAGAKVFLSNSFETEEKNSKEPSGSFQQKSGQQQQQQALQIYDDSILKEEKSEQRRARYLRKKIRSDNPAFSRQSGNSDFWNPSKALQTIPQESSAKSFGSSALSQNEFTDSVKVETDKLFEKGRRPNRMRKKSLSDNGAFVKHLTNNDFWNPNPTKDGTTVKIKKENTMSVEKGTMLAEMVGNKNTTALRQLISPEEQQKMESRRKPRPRPNRQKSVSDGVAAMFAMSGNAVTFLPGSSEFTESNKNAATLEPGQPRLQQQQHQHTSNSSDDLSLPTEKSETTRSRHVRKKSRSDNPVFSRQSWNSDFWNPSISNSLFTIPQESSHRQEDSLDVDNSLLGHTEVSDSAIEETDKDSVCTAFSEGGYSDLDDVPEVDLSQKLRHQRDYDPRVCPLRGYFLSKRYIIVSNIFGTMTCFYLVGQRVEGFVTASGVLVEQNTPDLDMKLSFWLETLWLIFFIIKSSLVIYLGHFRPLEFSTRQRRAVHAALLDLGICATCFLLLMIAEAQRCSCDYVHIETADDDHHRDLAVAYEEDYAVSCCEFGGRKNWGEIGNIEPFTALVLLRICRFFAAKKIVKFLDGRRMLSDTDKKDNDRKEADESVHAKKGLGIEKGTAIELWQMAVSKFPLIVEKHGEFSSELLQAMLGIDVIEHGPVAAKGVEPGREIMQGVGMAQVASDGDIHQITSSRSPTSTIADSNAKHSDSPIHLINKRYAKLSNEAQGIILAGRLGRNVRFRSGDNAPITVEEEVEPGFSDLINLHMSSDSMFTSFGHPNARLARSMRRCYKKLLPFLSEWTPVDVVITQFEIVYFEVSPNENENEVDFTMEALRATKGGKGLRLRDVAVGRKVRGKLELADIIEVHVNREFAVADKIDKQNDEDEEPTSFMRNEFWKMMAEDHLSDAAQNGGPSRLSRWKKVTQDSLVIHTISGNLHLRFFQDLEDIEAHTERIEEEKATGAPLFKNNAFQWAQTVVRYCGLDQLKQPLPNYGANDVNELRDYLQIVVQDRPQRHRRLNSRNSMLLTFGRQNSTILHAPQDDSEIGDVEASEKGAESSDAKPHRRVASSVDFTSTNFNNNKTPPKRAGSFDDAINTC